MRKRTNPSATQRAKRGPAAKRRAKPKQTLVEFFRDSPLAKAMAEYEIDFSRSKDTGRPFSFD